MGPVGSSTRFGRPLAFHHMRRIASIVFDRQERPLRAVIRTRWGTVNVVWQNVCGDRGWFTIGTLDAKKQAVPVIERIERMAARL